MNASQLTSDASTQLNTVDIHSYELFLSDLYKLANETNISTIWISSASQAIFNRIPTEKRLIASKI